MNTTPAITLDWVREQKAKHKAALADLEATERVLLEAAAQGRQTPKLPAQKPKPEGYGAKKRTLLRVIAESGNGLTTQAAITEGTTAGLEGLRAENVAPKLSNYRKKGLLKLEHGVWKITDKGHEYLVPTKS